MTDKLSREDVLRVAGEPAAYVEFWPNGDKRLVLRKDWRREDYAPLYTESQLLAMYAAGAEDMRERAKAKCSQIEDDYLEHRIFPEECDMTQAAAACGSCADLIRALPITTNTKGEQGGL